MNHNAEAQSSINTTALAVKQSSSVEFDTTGLKGVTLREYQKVGAKFMLTQPISLLLDEVGLGKTFQLIAVCVALNKQGLRGIILVPGHLRGQWVDGIINHTDLRLLQLKGEKEKRHSKYKDAYAYDLVICTYGTVVVDFDHLVAMKLDFVIIDETTCLTNRDNKTHTYVKWLCRGKKHVHVATATPLMSRRPVDLHNILEAMGLSEMLFGSYDQFIADFEMWKEKRIRVHGGRFITRKEFVGSSADQMNSLSTKLDPFFIRRLRADVGRELPAVTPETHWVDLTPLQQKLYDDVKNNILTMSDGERRQVGFRGHMQLLSRIITSPRLIDAKFSAESPKLDALIDLLKNDLDGKKVIVFANWLETHSMLKERLAKERIRHVEITGDLNDAQKDIAKRQFINDRDIRVLHVTAAADTGFDGFQHVCADMILLDLRWNPAKLIQLVGRLARDGQPHPVFVHYVMARETVEDKVFHLLRKKNLVPSQFFDEEASELFDPSVLDDAKDLF